VSTILGIDLGSRRIGVAIAETDGFAARPLVTLRRRSTIEADAAAIQDLIDVHAADALVIGLPLEAAGDEGPQATLTRTWATELAEHLADPIDISFQDERLSSHLAEQRLGPMKRGRSGGPPSPSQRATYRERVDREAAAIILQDSLDARAAAQHLPARSQPNMEPSA
jgi:putative pre-16S rRNA nuclease